MTNEHLVVRKWLRLIIETSRSSAIGEASGGRGEARRAAARGETLLRPEIMARLLARTELSDREREVLIGAARGERSKEIAARLGISERTVKAHLASIYNKLGVDSRAAAIAVATQRGLI